MALTVAEYQTEAVEASSTETPGIDIAPVTAWLAANVGDNEPPFTFDLIAAGGSNLTFRLTDSDGRQWALRRPPVGSALATAHDMGREWRIMAALGEASDVPVPEMTAFCDDHSVNGADFYVMSFVEGLILRDQESAAAMTPEQAESATQSLLDVQVAFHTLDLGAWPPPATSTTSPAEWTPCWTTPPTWPLECSNPPTSGRGGH